MSITSPQKTVTALLSDIRAGDDSAREKLFQLVYAELRGQADRLMRRERRGHTLSATGLLHQAFFRLGKPRALQQLTNRKHFFGAAKRAMRQVLIDYARVRQRTIEAAQPRVPMDEALDAVQTRYGAIEGLVRALDDLKSLSTRQSEVAEYRIFGGHTMNEIARLLGVSLATVEKDWRIARAWLRSNMDSDRQSANA